MGPMLGKETVAHQSIAPPFLREVCGGREEEYIEL